MRMRTGSRRGETTGGIGMLVAATLCGLGSSGCAETLTIRQARYINNAMHQQTLGNPDQWTGMPMELNIVCVHPADLERGKADNAALGRDGNITSKEWFKLRPKPEDNVDGESNGGRFRLPRNQIFCFTNTAPFYGIRVGAALQGASHDGEERQFDIAFDRSLFHDTNAIVYVFGRFEDEGRNVLPVPPARFYPLSRYRDDFAIRIGVGGDGHASNPFGQYIDVDSRSGARARN